MHKSVSNQFKANKFELHCFTIDISITLKITHHHYCKSKTTGNSQKTIKCLQLENEFYFAYC